MTDFDLLIGKWSFGVVEDVNSLFHTREGDLGNQNIFNYSNPEVDRILTAYDGARTDTEAQDAYHLRARFPSVAALIAYPQDEIRYTDCESARLIQAGRVTSTRAGRLRPNWSR